MDDTAVGESGAADVDVDVDVGVKEETGAQAERLSRDPAKERQLGVRVVAFVITLCVLVAGWAVVQTRESGRGPGAGKGTAPSSTAGTASAAVPAAPPRLVQHIPATYPFPA